uniref:C2H2-type domain-containing protein n=1 Tax=Gopherus agassizii TaxID=38772 RepID=A0A452GYP3_9SAUR
MVPAGRPWPALTPLTALPPSCVGPSDTQTPAPELVLHPPQTWRGSTAVGSPLPLPRLAEEQPPGLTAGAPVTPGVTDRISRLLLEAMQPLEVRSVFEAAQDPTFLHGLSLVNCSSEDLPSTDCNAITQEKPVVADGEERAQGVPEISDRMCCSSCSRVFDSREEQTEHYRLDWHRFNLKQRLLGRQALTAEEFEEKTRAGDVSSISGSDSDDSDSGSESDLLPPREHTDPGSSQQSLRPGTRSAKVLFRNSQGQLLSAYRCVLGSKKGGGEQQAELVASLQSMGTGTCWVILMTGGGHFAGAVFRGTSRTYWPAGFSICREPSASSCVSPVPTGHCSSVGGTPLCTRTTPASAASPSAPAELPSGRCCGCTRPWPPCRCMGRTQWWRILLASPGRAGGKCHVRGWKSPSKVTPAVSEGEGHWRVGRALADLPPPTLMRVSWMGEGAQHRTLCGSSCLLFVPQPCGSPWESRFQASGHPISALPQGTGWGTIVDSPDLGTVIPSGPFPQFTCGEGVGPLAERTGVGPPAPISPVSPKVLSEEENEESQAGELEMVDVTLSTLHLRESEVTPKRSRKKRRKKDKVGRGARAEGPRGQEEPEGSSSQPGAETVTDPQEGSGAEPAPWRKGETPLGQLRDALFTACKTGDVGTLRRLLGVAESGAPPAGSEDGAMGQSQGHPGRVQSEGSEPNHAVPGLLSLLSEPIDGTGFTLLHVAAAAGKGAAVRLLLEAGADPALRDRQERPPYCVSADKSTRNVFRKFMVDHPAKYDYGRAKVPGPLTAEMEARRLEKQRAQKTQRKQRAQELREQQQRLAQEQEEKRRFAALPDREKRALAAERRLAAQLQDTGAALANTRRCWQCGESLLGRIPFHYHDFSFCSTACLQTHRRGRAGPP